MPPALGPEAVCAPGKPSLPLEQSEWEQRFVCTNLIARLFLDAHPAPCRWLDVRRRSSPPHSHEHSAEALHRSYSNALGCPGPVRRDFAASLGACGNSQAPTAGLSLGLGCRANRQS